MQHRYFKALHPDDFERVKESIVRSAQTMEQWQDRYRVNPAGRVDHLG